jgi:hypothetical protein
MTSSIDSTHLIGWAALAALIVFVAYVAAALHSLQHRALFFLGGVAVLLAFVGVFLQAAYVRWQLGRLDAAARAHPSDVPDAGPSGAEAYVLRAYAVRVSPALTAQARRRLPPPELVEPAFVLCGPDAPGSAPATYTDARYVVVMRGGQGTTLRDDVLSGRVRYLVAANTVWRVTALQDADCEAALAASAFEAAVFVLADATAVQLVDGNDEDGGGGGGSAACTLPENTLPLTLARTPGILRLDALLSSGSSSSVTPGTPDATASASATATATANGTAGGPRAVVTLHAWGYGWGGGTAP